jgi:hypothetical protein
MFRFPRILKRVQARPFLPLSCSLLFISLGLVLESKELQSEITEVMRQNMEKYLSVEFVFFGNGSYYDDNLQIFFGAVNDFNYLLSRIYFLSKKELLEFQAAQL